MGESNNKCFVCKKGIDSRTAKKNPAINLPVCSNCSGTEKEKEAEKEFLESLADGLVCGCI